MSDPHARQRFLDGMSTIAAGVHVVTTDGPEGWAGVTVTAMTSVSADGEAPTLLVCLHHQSAAAPLILGNKVFCVNVLRADQAHVSDAFAGRFRQPNKDKFATGSWTTMRTGAPRLANPLAAFDCARLAPSGRHACDAARRRAGIVRRRAWRHAAILRSRLPRANAPRCPSAHRPCRRRRSNGPQTRPSGAAARGGPAATATRIMEPIAPGSDTRCRRLTLR